MTIYNKPTDLPAWAESGDKVQPTNAEIQTGWPVSTVPPSRQRFNWILNWLANGMRYFMQRGIPEWDATEEYPAGARVQYAGLTYNAINGTANTNQQPDTATTFWERWGFSASEIISNDSFLSKSVAGSANVTLTTAEAKNGIIALTGAITANINVVVPATSKRWVIRNDTTGAFSITVKTSGGTGVAVLQGSSAELYCDGTNVDFSPKSGPTPAQFDGSKKLATMEALQRALGSFSGESNLSATATLTAADVGKAVLMATSTGSQVLTLPAASAVVAGGAITIQSQSTVDFSVARAGTDTLNPDGNTLTSITVKNGEWVLAVSNGSNQWALYGSATLQYAASFTSSQAVNGYQQLPGGLILQWGTYQTTAANTNQTFTLPLTFPNSFLLSYSAHFWNSNNPTSIVTGVIAKDGLSQIVLRTSAGAQMSVLCIGN